MDEPVVSTDRGRVRGLRQGTTVAFRGLPYAEAPQGPLRFGPPVPRGRWDGVRDCRTPGTASPQLPPAPGVPPVWRPGDGLDCLTLDVWTPDLAGSGLPVMVWFHGGLWKLGWTGMPQYDAAVLASGGLVVVTVNYRLGFEGFGHVPGAPDNRGLLDQLAALDWVRRNVASFGGAADAVTVVGQSAGAASVALLVGAPSAAGLFRRAVAQSVPAGHRTVEEAGAVTATIAAAAGVPATREALTALPPEVILAVQDAPLRGPRDGMTAFGPVLDGELVTGPPGAALANGSAREVDLLCGSTREEFRGIGPGGSAPPGADPGALAGMLGLGPGASAAYRAAAPAATDAELAVTMLSDALVRIPTVRVAEAHAGAGGCAWLYDLAWGDPVVGAGHGVDVPLVFGNDVSRYAARLLGSPPPATFGPLSEAVRASWTAFAATGDPGWPRYDLERRCTRVWDTTPSDVDDPLGASRAIWAGVG